MEMQRAQKSQDIFAVEEQIQNKYNKFTDALGLL